MAASYTSPVFIIHQNKCSFLAGGAVVPTVPQNESVRHREGNLFTAKPNGNSWPAVSSGCVVSGLCWPQRII